MFEWKKSAAELTFF